MLITNKINKQKFGTAIIVFFVICATFLISVHVHAHDDFDEDQCAICRIINKQIEPLLISAVITVEATVVRIEIPALFMPASLDIFLPCGQRAPPLIS